MKIELMTLPNIVLDVQYYIDILDIRMEFMLEEKEENSLVLWLKVVDAKEIDKRLEAECRRTWYCIEDMK